MSIFDGEWHSYIESAANPPALEPHGRFNFSVNPVNGALTDGSVHNSTTITGATVQAAQSIDITETVPPLGEIRYVGSVTFQGVVGGVPRIVACGKFTLKRPNVESQEEGTWVITKP